MIDITWAQLKQILASSGMTAQWFQDDNSYTVFDNALVFRTVIPITSPESSDQLDFENSYKTTAGYSAIASYSCATVILPASTPTDIFTLTGSSTKTVRLSKITLSGRNVLPTSATISLIARASADSGGTASTPTITAHDPNSSAATATVTSYTANPTLGTPIGLLRTANLVFSNTGGSPVPLLVWDFPESLHKPVLRNSSQQFCINLNGTGISAVHLSIEWTEE